MSHIWTFSPSSEPLLQRCIEAALLQETDNEWTQHFGRTNFTTKPDPPAEKTISTAEIIEIPPSQAEEKKPQVSVTYEDFFSSIENEIRLDYITKECSINPDLLSIMAQKLSINIVEKLFNQVFASKDIENRFLIDLFHKFLPQHIKFQNSRLCIDLLTKINEKYPEMFQTLLRILLEDVEIPNQVLNNYIATLDEQKVTIFMENLTTIELSSGSFTHNILTIYTAYKNCKHTEKIQSYIKTNLLQHSKSCTSDRNYGRLFLAYLQTEKLLEHEISKNLEDCLEIHHSPFKRPCTMLIKELCQND